MRRSKSSTFWAWVVLLDMGCFIALKAHQGLLPELLWICNAASLLLVPGLWFQWTRLVGMAFLVRLAVGEPGHLVALVSTGTVAWSSVLAHLPPTLGAYFYLREHGFPRQAPAQALAFTATLMAASRLLTPPALNVNLVFQPHGLLFRWAGGSWAYVLLLTLLIVGSLFGVGRGLDLWFNGRKGEEVPEGAS